MNQTRNGIGTLNEHSLHSDLIRYLSRPTDQLEMQVDGFVIDIIRGNQAIEVQTKNLSKLIKKIKKINQNYDVLIYYPIFSKKWIVRKDQELNVISRRKSPKHGRVEDIFFELARSSNLLTLPRVFISILLIQGEEVWSDDGLGSWRRKHWSIIERHLINVDSIHTFTQPADWIKLLPRSLPNPFSNKILAKQTGITTGLAGKITYTFRKIGLLEIVHTEGREYYFRVSEGINL